MCVESLMTISMVSHQPVWRLWKRSTFLFLSVHLMEQGPEEAMKLWADWHSELKHFRRRARIYDLEAMMSTDIPLDLRRRRTMNTLVQNHIRRFMYDIEQR